jgi:hypothetical protein
MRRIKKIECAPQQWYKIKHSYINCTSSNIKKIENKKNIGLVTFLEPQKPRANIDW